MWGCIQLGALFITASSVPTLSASAFQSTPIVNSTFLSSFGSIYVPSSLYSAYISANNWSAFSARIVPLLMEE
jgi:hypothetical protein